MAEHTSDSTLSGQAIVRQSPASRNGTSKGEGGESTHKATITLTDLTAKLRVYIFELAMPTNTAICLRVEPLSTNKFHYRIRPSLAGLYETCKQLRLDYPIARYYATNTFVVTDAMLNQPYSIAAFVEARKPAADHIRRLRVDHSIMGHYDAHHSKRSFRIRYSFDAVVIHPGQIAIQWARATVMHSKLGINAFLFEDEVCLCGVQESVSDRNTLLEVLDAYATTLASRKRSEHPWYTGHIEGVKCEECGEWRYV